MILRGCTATTAVVVVVVGRKLPQIILIAAAAAIQGSSCCCALARPLRAIAFPPLLLSFRPWRAAGPMSSSSTPSLLTPASERTEEAAVAAAKEKKMEGAPDASSDIRSPAVASHLPAAASDPPLPPPPEVPAPGDCCGNGCVRCVWDIYYDELEAYDKLVAVRSPGTKKLE